MQQIIGSSGFRDFNIVEMGMVYYLENRDMAGTVPRGERTEVGF